jgi:hypothetical protein
MTASWSADTVFSSRVSPASLAIIHPMHRAARRALSQVLRPNPRVAIGTASPVGVCVSGDSAFSARRRTDAPARRATAGQGRATPIRPSAPCHSKRPIPSDSDHSVEGPDEPPLRGGRTGPREMSRSCGHFAGPISFDRLGSPASSARIRALDKLGGPCRRGLDRCGFTRRRGTAGP